MEAQTPRKNAGFSGLRLENLGGLAIISKR